MNTLHHFPLSPFSRKVRLVLAEKKLDVKLVEEAYWSPSIEFVKLNPAGRVPVLKTDGHILAESNAICEYLEEVHPQPPLMPRSAAERAEMRRLVNWFDDGFYREVTRKLVGERILKKLQGGGQPNSANVKEGTKAIKFHLDYMGDLLEARRWLAGNQMTLADFSAAAQLSCVDYVSDVDWNRNEAVKNWYATMKSRPAFRSLLIDQLAGFPPPPHYANLDF